MVLDRPEIPLHTNGSENDVRCQVTKRKVSGGTRSDMGRNDRRSLHHQRLHMCPERCDWCGRITSLPRHPDRPRPGVHRNVHVKMIPEEKPCGQYLSSALRVGESSESFAVES